MKKRTFTPRGDFDKSYEDLVVFLQSLGLNEIAGFRMEDIIADVNEQKAARKQLSELKQAYLSGRDTFNVKQRERYTHFSKITSVVKALYADDPNYQSVVDSFRRKYKKSNSPQENEA